MRPTILVTCGVLVLAFAAPAVADEGKSTEAKTQDTKVNKERAKAKTQETKKKEKAKAKAAEEKRDSDAAVSTTRTTRAVVEPRRDVAETRAEERREVEGKRFSAAPMLGYGSNGLGVGLGARFGYTFETPVYVGGNVMFHAGEMGVSSSFYPSAEVGYDLGVGSWLLRPYGGGGVFLSAGTSTALIYPGFTAHYLFPNSPAFVGGDARLLVPVEFRTAAFVATATGGLNF
ncbi:MAG TPA: hypothetical protein VM925_29705 [Labilithrix sp.]|nr:hypothetical protein [Labilithrix sp.]